MRSLIKYSSIARQSLTAQTVSPVQCQEPDKCSEVFDTKCVIYSGDDIICQETTVVAKNDNVSIAIQSIVDYFCVNGGGGGGTGAQGAQGVQGKQGSQGASGINGTNGTNGTQGSQGVQGTQGVQGRIGSTGAQGAIGDQGSPGLNGSQGTQGTQGVQGKTGAQGFTGSQGATGSTGSTGLTGAQGSTGSQGIIGSTGLTGAQGSTGGIGLTGAQGSTGAQGITGSTGLTGSQGAQGTSGTNGTNGAQGATGSNGLNGAQGADGAQGSAGSSATTTVLAKTLFVDPNGSDVYGMPGDILNPYQTLRGAMLYIINNQYTGYNIHVFAGTYAETSSLITLSELTTTTTVSLYLESETYITYSDTVPYIIYDLNPSSFYLQLSIFGSGNHENGTTFEHSSIGYPFLNVTAGTLGNSFKMYNTRLRVSNYSKAVFVNELASGDNNMEINLERCTVHTDAGYILSMSNIVGTGRSYYIARNCFFSTVLSGIDGASKVFNLLNITNENSIHCETHNCVFKDANNDSGIKYFVETNGSKTEFISNNDLYWSKDPSVMYVFANTSAISLIEPAFASPAYTNVSTTTQDAGGGINLCGAINTCAALPEVHDIGI